MAEDPEHPTTDVAHLAEAHAALAARVARLEAQLVDVYAHEDDDPLPAPGIVGVDHIAMAVPVGELDAHVATYRALGFTEVHREDVGGSDQVREVMLRIGAGPTLIQLLEPLSADSPVARQLERHGGRSGLAHIAYRVIDIHAAFAALTAAGFRIVDAAPRPGSRGTLVFFVHPRTTPAAAVGYPIEFVQEGVGV